MDLINEIQANNVAKTWREKELKNALPADASYQVSIDTLTGIKKKVVEQKFYTLGGKTPSDYIPMTIGENAFMENINIWKSFDNADSFEAGNMDTGSSNAALSGVESGLTPQTIKIITWAKKVGYSIVDVEKASNGANSAGWSKITSLETARKRNWDLGIQKVAFLGTTDGSVEGLLNNSLIDSNTSIITKAIKSMTTSEFTTFATLIIDAYYTHSNSTVYPSKFVIPTTDWNGLMVPYDTQLPTYSRMQFLQDAFKGVTGNQAFEILPVAYGDSTHNGLGLQRYCMYNYEDTSGEMQIPVPYTTTNINTSNGFFFESVAYGQYSGFNVYRAAEFLYFDY